MKKRLLVFLLVLSLIAPCLDVASAHGKAKEHYSDMEKVLFGGKYHGVSQSELNVLEFATTIAIDQSGDDDQNQLQELHSFGVENLPDSVMDTVEMNPKGIHITKSSGHRAYTHQGWTYNYSKSLSMANWPVRKDVIRETVKKVFNFDTVDDKKCDSFSAVLYYVHILGDLQEDSKYKENGQIISLVEAHPRKQYESNTDIFIELEHYLPILFKDQVDDAYYKQMMRKIKNLHSEAMATAKTGWYAEGRMDMYHQYVKDLLEILSENMSPLLEKGMFLGVL